MAIERRETPESWRSGGSPAGRNAGARAAHGPESLPTRKETHLAGSGPILFRQPPRTAFERWTAFRGTMPDATAAYGVEGRVSRRPTLRSRMTERWLSHRSPRWHDTTDPATTPRAGLFDLQVDLEQDQRPQGDRQSRRSDVGEAVQVREVMMLLGNHDADDHVNQRDDSSHSHSHSHKTTPLASGRAERRRFERSGPGAAPEALPDRGQGCTNSGIASRARLRAAFRV